MLVAIDIDDAVDDAHVETVLGGEDDWLLDGGWVALGFASVEYEPGDVVGCCLGVGACGCAALIDDATDAGSGGVGELLVAVFHGGGDEGVLAKYGRNWCVVGLDFCEDEWGFHHQCIECALAVSHGEVGLAGDAVERIASDAGSEIESAFWVEACCAWGDCEVCQLLVGGWFLANAVFIADNAFEALVGDVPYFVDDRAVGLDG